MDTVDLTLSAGNRDIQCGPDGRLYTNQYAAGGQPKLGMITDPNLAGVACGYHRDTIVAAAGIGMSSFVSGLPRLYWPVINTAEGVDGLGPNAVLFSMSPNPAGNAVVMRLDGLVGDLVLITWIDALGRRLRSTVHDPRTPITQSVLGFSTATYSVHVERKGVVLARGSVTVVR